MKETSEKTGSNIVLALDLTQKKSSNLLSKSIGMLETVYPYICAVKINRQLTLPLGVFEGIRKVVNFAHDYELPVIMDCKINDVGYTNRAIAEWYFKAGFDAVTANPFVGWCSGLDQVFEAANKMRKGVILLVYMSHKGSEEGYGQIVQDQETSKLSPQYTVFAKKALSWGADGVVVGATYPEKIKEVFKFLKNRVPIYSPGIGVQGGKIESTAAAGTRFFIVGRAITLSEEPDKTAKAIRDISKRFMTEY
jgi:orotidine-5'-phosphate decarboxylase